MGDGMLTLMPVGDRTPLHKTRLHRSDRWRRDATRCDVMECVALRWNQNQNSVVAVLRGLYEPRKNLLACCCVWRCLFTAYVFDSIMSWDGEKEFVQEVSSITTHKPPVSQKKVGTVTKIAIKHPKVFLLVSCLVLFFVTNACTVLQKCGPPYRKISW